MTEAFGADQRWQVLGFYDFCNSNNLIDEVQNKQWKAFGEAYNGDGAVYGPKLKDAFNTKQALLAFADDAQPAHRETDHHGGGTETTSQHHGGEAEAKAGQAENHPG